MHSPGVNPRAIDPRPLDGHRIAVLEEWRQARSVAEIASESEDVAGGTMSWSGPGSWSNQASGLGLRGPVSHRDLDRVVAFYRDRGAPARIEVASHADETLLRGLRSRGFGLVAFELVFAAIVEPGEDSHRRMTVPLAERVAIGRHEPGDDAADEAFARVSMSGFVPAGGELAPNDLAVGLRCIRHPRSINVGAWEGPDRRLVGAGGMELMPDAPDEDGTPTPVACFFGVSVLPEARRRGIQQALIAERLQACADAGCRLACIHSPPGIGTERNAQRMGFDLAYTKVTLADG